MYSTESQTLDQNKENILKLTSSDPELKNDFINEEIYPFKIDHSKCLSCQQIDRLDPKSDTYQQDLVNGQKGQYLCSSCQWHLSGVSDQIRKTSKGRDQMRNIESNLSNLGIDIYFDTDSIETIKAKVYSKLDDDNDTKELEIELLKIEQLQRLGIKWDSGY